MMNTTTIRTPSPRVQQLLAVIDRITRTKGRPPSLREAARVLDVHPSRVGQLAVRARDLGLLTAEARTARSWRLTTPVSKRRPTR